MGGSLDQLTENLQVFPHRFSVDDLQVQPDVEAIIGTKNKNATEVIEHPIMWICHAMIATIKVLLAGHRRVKLIRSLRFQP